MTLYMAVTADEYELPLIVERYPDILCKKLGIKKISLFIEMARQNAGNFERNGRNNGYVLRKVEVEDDEEEG